MKKTLINLTLLVLAIIILGFLIVPSLVVAFVVKGRNGGIKAIGKYISGIFITLAEDIDRSGNYLGGDLLNFLFIDKYKALEHYNEVSIPEFLEFCVENDARRLFGDIRETISSVLGKNKEIKTLTYSGELLCKILDFLDPDHCKKSIKWYKREKPNEL